MISAELQGKLGNMLFQIAAIESMGYRTGIPTGYPHVDKNVDDLAKPQSCTSEFHGREYFKLFKNFDWHKNSHLNPLVKRTVNVPFEYTPITPRDYTCYIGYFQSELYFPDRAAILHLFEPAEFIKEKLDKYKDVIGTNKAAIHIRRGDYIKLNHIYNVLDVGYYMEAIGFMRSIGIEEFLIFSTDTEWCKEVFKGSQFTFIRDESSVELFLMGKCGHQIIANSAFSWWGAYLNSFPGKVVIAPRKWFTSKTLTDKDIIPDSWMKI